MQVLKPAADNRDGLTLAELEAFVGECRQHGLSPSLTRIRFETQTRTIRAYGLEADGPVLADPTPPPPTGDPLTQLRYVVDFEIVPRARKPLPDPPAGWEITDANAPGLDFTEGGILELTLNGPGEAFLICWRDYGDFCTSSDEGSTTSTAEWLGLDDEEFYALTRFAQELHDRVDQAVHNLSCAALGVARDDILGRALNDVRKVEGASA